jgi:hypothetical protein
MTHTFRFRESTEEISKRSKTSMGHLRNQMRLLDSTFQLMMVFL